jgi:hypothetical protein
MHGGVHLCRYECMYTWKRSLTTAVFPLDGNPPTNTGGTGASLGPARGADVYVCTCTDVQSWIASQCIALFLTYFVCAMHMAEPKQQNPSPGQERTLRGGGWAQAVRTKHAHKAIDLRLAPKPTALHALHVHHLADHLLPVWEDHGLMSQSSRTRCPRRTVRSFTGRRLRRRVL